MSEPEQPPRHRSAARRGAPSHGSSLSPRLLGIGAVALVALVATAAAVLLGGRSSGPGAPVAVVTTPTVTAPGATASGAAPPTANASAAATARRAPATPSTARSSAGPTGGVAASPVATALVAGEWKVVTYRFQDDGIGDFGGSARITYTGADPAGGVANVSFTVLKGGHRVGTLVGSILGAAPGQTTSVDLLSTDKYVPGPYSAVQFQKEL